jgi:hypothetical protein
MGKVTQAERKAMEDFRDFNISLEQLRPLIVRRAGFNFRPTGPYTRGINKHTDPAEPPIPISVQHLHRAYLNWRDQKISKVDLADWASMLLMNDDFESAEDETEIIAEWLNDVASSHVGPVLKG